MSGIYAELLDGNQCLDASRWNRALREQTAVGGCRQVRCRGLMYPVPTSEQGHVSWYGAQCADCGGEVAIRAGKPVLRGSSARGLMDSGSFDRREAQLRAAAELAKQGKATNGKN